MQLIISEDDEFYIKAANMVCERLNAFKPSAKKPFYVLGLPTGGTPLPLYQELVRRYKAGNVSFKNVVTFNMDEYIGLDFNHPQSYHYYMQKNFFENIDILPENTHLLNGMMESDEDIALECLNYEKSIVAHGGIDLFIGGVGEDGHIAFNEPGSSLKSRTRVKTLTNKTVEVNKRFFNNDATQVPTKVLTVGVGTILDAREILILVRGESKARALHYAVEQGVNHLWTISALQLHEKANILCDESSTLELRVKTYRYFKALTETLGL